MGNIFSGAGRGYLWSGIADALRNIYSIKSQADMFSDRENLESLKHQYRLEEIEKRYNKMAENYDKIYGLRKELENIKNLNEAEDKKIKLLELDRKLTETYNDITKNIAGGFTFDKTHELIDMIYKIKTQVADELDKTYNTEKENNKIPTQTQNINKNVITQPKKVINKTNNVSSDDEQSIF